jgi:hypothetical protein
MTRTKKQDLVREELVEIPQTRTRTRRGRPCPRRAADEPGVNEQRRRSPSRSCGRRSEPTTGFRHRKPDEEADAHGNHQTRERTEKWSAAGRRGNQMTKMRLSAYLLRKQEIVEETKVNDRCPAAQDPDFAADQIPTLLRGPPTKTSSRLLLLGTRVLTSN